MANRKKEVAKFFCGFETFHAVAHGVMWWTGTTITAFGVTAGPTWQGIGVLINGLTAIALGVYAWRGATP